MDQSSKVLRDFPYAEATRDPIFLLEVRREEGGPWVVDYGSGVWMTRQEAEDYAMRREYHYGKQGLDWRVYCCCAEGKLATLLMQHTRMMEVVK